jgi:DNA modification methylase
MVFSPRSATIQKQKKFRFDLMHWNVSIGPEKWPIFGRFLTLFPLKLPAWHEKNTSNMAVTIGDVMDDVTCKSFI